MANPIYKQSTLKRIVFYMGLAFVALCFPQNLYAQANPVYTVEGVEVDVTAQNAVLARQKALDEAQAKAYKMLAERLLTPEEVASLKIPDPITLSTLVQDFEVVKEQVSKVRYKGEYIFRFRPNAMKSQMANQGKIYSDTIQKPIMVLPIFQEGGKNLLWEESNPWMKGWRSLPSDKNQMQPTVLPLGDVQDVSQISGDEGLNLDPIAAQELASRYGADDVAILIASINKTPSGNAALVVNLYHNGFEGPVFAKKVSIEKTVDETVPAFYTRAALKVKSMLRGEWKNNDATITPAAITSHQPQTPVVPVVPVVRPALGVPTNYTAIARFSSVQDWVRLKSTLDRIYGMQSVMIKGLKPREATLDLRFAGDGNALVSALQNAGLSMRGGGQNAFEIFMGPAMSPSTIYQ